MTKDYCGNVRAVLDQNHSVVERNEYYPYGGLINASDTQLQPYKYSSKELDRENGLDWYDFSARMYDPMLPQFDGVDKWAEIDYHTSPYAYCGGNPINYIDPSGNVRISKRLQQRHPQLAVYLKSLPSIWKSKDQHFKTSFLKHSGLSEKQFIKMLSWGKGPKIGVKDLEGQMGHTLQLTTTYRDNKGRKIPSSEKTTNTKDNYGNNIYLNKLVVDLFETAMNSADTNKKGAFTLLLESTIFHEFTHFGNAETSNTSQGKYKESGKDFENDVYGGDVSTNNAEEIFNNLNKNNDETKNK